MIRLDTGEKIELHIHNVKFEDATKEIVVDAATETYWIGADRVAYYWIHREGFEKEYYQYLYLTQFTLTWAV